MVDLRTLGILLDQLQGGEDSPRALRPATPVARAAPIARVARDGSQPDLPLARIGVRTLAADVLTRRSPDSKVDAGSSAGSTPRSVRPGEIAPVVRDLHPPSPSSSLELSATVQWVQRSLLTDRAQQTAASIRAAGPLMMAPPADAEPLAQALRQSIAQSGLFYESHLADWTVQQYPQSELLREPQAQWTGAMTMHDGSATGGSGLEDQALAQSSAGDERALASQPGAPTSGQAGGLPSVELLRAQLQTLETRQFSWQGELWPGQTASLTIAEDRSSAQSESHAAWRTHMRLTLPELGAIDVDLYLDGGTLRVALSAPGAQSVSLLNAACPELVSSLEAHTHASAAIGIRQS